MKLDQAQVFLDRINRLFSDISSSGVEASALERDLLKEYVRRLYESLTDEASNTFPKAPPKASAQPAPAFTFEPEPPAPSTQPQAPSPQPQAPSPQPHAPSPQPPPDQNTVVRPAPKVIEIPEEVMADVRRTEAHRQVATPVAQVEVQESPFAPEISELSPKMKALFEVERSSDLSDKLAGAPIKDMTRSMAINERLLTQNELFGGSKHELDQALQHLNELHDYEAAVSYLAGGAALDHDWLDEERKATARAFIKLVRRRYA